MRSFSYFEPKSVQDAVDILNRHSGEATVMAGGTDLLSRFKNDIRTELRGYVVDISGLELDYIEPRPDGGLRIGATTSLSAVAESQLVRDRAPLLAMAAGDVASPPLRNMGTVGGDLLQQVWCWYLRNDYDCWRNAGNICYGAIGDNRFYHSIFGGRLCYAVHASDLGPALLALDGTVKIVGPMGENILTIDKLLPGISIVDGHVKENAIHFNEILTEVQVPPLRPDGRQSWFKDRARKSWDFALASAAIYAVFQGGDVTDSRIVLGGVDVKPRRSAAAEQALNGNSLSDSTIDRVSEASIEGAAPLTIGTGNEFRVEILKGVVRKALRTLSLC
ncbi:MAG TPA: xanthine dehydrogenase family protein subunit M [Candidatus Bathyarchaeia archaeon]|nr:xanthine dehydrogenase family protein subunit M [Candidatus Bathyarchaeia archaeon]